MAKILVFGHRNPDTDAIGAAIGLARLEVALGTDAEAVALGPPNPETRYALDLFGITAPRIIERAGSETLDVMLVDHNERQQSVADIAELTVHRVVDHHRVANFETTAPLWFRAEPVGCTCTILHRMYDENDIPIPRDTAGVMVSAIISDTLLLKGPTTTGADRRAATELAAIAGIDLEEYGTDLLRAGAAIGDTPAATLIARDSKRYVMAGSAVQVAQLNIVDPTQVLARRDEFLTAMRAERNASGYQLFLLLVTNVFTCDSDVLVVGEPISALERAFGVTVDDGHAFVRGLVSRKKQVVPPLTEALTTERRR